MNGQRIVRKYLWRLTNEELLGLWKVAKDETTHEGMIVFYLVTCELEKRKVKINLD